MAGFGRYIAWKLVDGPALPFKNGGRQILQWNPDADMSGAYIPHNAVIGGGTGYPARMDQYTVSTLEIGRILIEFKRERFRRLNKSCAAYGAECLNAGFQPAVVQQIRNILIGRPPLALHQPSEPAEVLQFYGLFRRMRCR